MDRPEMRSMFEDEAIDARQRWFGQVLLWDRGHWRMLRLEVAYRGTGGGPGRRFMDVVIGGRKRGGMREVRQRGRPEGKKSRIRFHTGLEKNTII